MGSRSRSAAALLIDAPKCRPPPEDAAARLQERDQRRASDTRSELQKLLGEPEPSRSALMQVRPPMPKGARSASGVRVDLWRK